MQANHPHPTERKQGSNHTTKLCANLQDLKQWVAETTDFGIPHFGELGTRLTSLREALSNHFRAEEAGGYLAEPLKVAPRFQREADGLFEQHQRLTDRIDEFSNRLQCSEEPFATWQEASARFDQLVHDIEAHEQQETALIQAAFEDDLGVGD